MEEKTVFWNKPVFKITAKLVDDRVSGEAYFVVEGPGKEQRIVKCLTIDGTFYVPMNDKTPMTRADFVEFREVDGNFGPGYSRHFKDEMNKVKSLGEFMSELGKFLDGSLS